MIRFLHVVVCFGLISTAANADVQHYDLLLGQRQVGTLSFDTDRMDLVTHLDNTPLGVADGRFTAQSSPARSVEGTAVTHYLSQSIKRQISFVLDETKVLTTSIIPPKEATPLSQPQAVPAGVIPLTEGFARLTTTGTCPAPFSAYDGRRVVHVATRAQFADGADILCEMDYRVTDGPGHLSPFRFSTLDMALRYRNGALAQVTVGAGGFELQMVRK